MKNAYIYINYNNIVVLKDYLDVIKTALEKLEYNCQYIKTLEDISKESLIIYPMSKDALKYYLHGYHNFAIWQQGATADESFMRNHSKIRRFVLNQIDVFCMKKAKFILFVSDYMKKHYEKMSHQDFTEKSYVMPCFNETFDESRLSGKNYDKNIFAYVGSLDLWQCFDKTVEIYKEIEKTIPNCFLKVLTFQEEEAKAILKKKGVQNFIVKKVPKEQVNKELMDCTYGFILREDNIVNRVATPTKLSSYLAAGVIPIFSECLVDFKSIAKKNRIGYAVENKMDTSKIEQFIMKDKDKKQIFLSITRIFNTYYNGNNHANKIYEKMTKVIK